MCCVMCLQGCGGGAAASEAAEGELRRVKLQAAGRLVDINDALIAHFKADIGTVSVTVKKLALIASLGNM